MNSNQEDRSRENSLELVHLVLDYWDGPREGIADYYGVPHYFKALFDQEIDEWTDVFLLYPLDANTYDLGMQCKQIWQQSRVLTNSGRATSESARAVSEDTKRAVELADIIRMRSESDPFAGVKLRGRFVADDTSKLTSDRLWQVYWQPQTD